MRHPEPGVTPVVERSCARWHKLIDQPEYRFHANSTARAVRPGSFQKIVAEERDLTRVVIVHAGDTTDLDLPRGTHRSTLLHTALLDS